MTPTAARARSSARIMGGAESREVSTSSDGMSEFLSRKFCVDHAKKIRIATIISRYTIHHSRAQSLAISLFFNALVGSQTIFERL